ncbi:hypothetical protein AB1Y20_003699 [Prymnesium parvum]|uniref:Uncharacterized protein n=1 Tax=Prymnesium parvum TaxID=97485 RepID=A0AB34J7Z8_PRYPA
MVSGVPDTPNTTSLIGFLHGIIRTLRSAVLSRLESDPPGIRFMLNNFSGDSNPCRATCMLNPVYEILPRADWIVSSNICQQPTDFSYDNISRSLCCPSPNYCCPNSISNCFDAKAVLFDVFKSGTPRQVIAKSWPRYQIDPYSWHLTAASRRYVVEVWRNESRAYRESIDSSCTLVRLTGLKGDRRMLQANPPD